METLDLATATRLVGDQVLVKDSRSGYSLSATVTDVETLALNGEDWESFVVMLEHSGELEMGQGSYDFEHEIFGSLPMFISPKSHTQAEIIVTRRLAEPA